MKQEVMKLVIVHKKLNVEENNRFYVGGGGGVPWNEILTKWVDV
jgi:hypothetical protein